MRERKEIIEHLIVDTKSLIELDNKEIGKLQEIVDAYARVLKQTRQRRKHHIWAVQFFKKNQIKRGAEHIRRAREVESLKLIEE